MNLDIFIKYLTQNAKGTEVFRVMTQPQIDKNMPNQVDRFPNVMKHRVFSSRMNTILVTLPSRQIMGLKSPLHLLIISEILLQAKLLPLTNLRLLESAAEGIRL